MKMKVKMRQVFGIILSLVLVLGLMPWMSMTAQAATTLTDTFTTNTGATEYTGDYSKVSGYVWIGATNKALALADPNTNGGTQHGGPITIETLNGEIIDKVVLSGVTNSQNAYVHPSSGNVTNTLLSGDCRYRLNDDGAIEIENINSTTLTISFHSGYGGTCYYANVVVYCHEVPVDITGVELNKTSTTLTVGETDTLTATVNPNNSDHTVAWSSDNESVATVSDGVVTAVAEGTANITVTATNGTDDTSDDKKATCEVVVAPITYTVTYKVANGAWSDGSSADKTEIVKSGANPANVPTGMIAASGYTGGSWDKNPSSAVISGNTTFTYTFVAASSSDEESSDSGSGSSSSSGSSDSGNTSGGTSSGSSDNTNINTDTSAKVSYDDVAISIGSVNDITGTASAIAESNPFGTKIENNSNLSTLLSLTDAEVAQGVNVWLNIQDMSASVPQTDKTLIQNTSGDYTVGLYLDINLFKKVGSNDATKVTETNGKVKASIVIPESLWKSGRTFEIIRVHDGVATAIAGTYDENTHVFTFETDKFSTYALAYKDPASSSNSGTTSDSSSSSNSGLSNSSNSTKSTAPKTGDPNDVRVWYLFLIASLGGLGFLGLSKKKEN